jgi:Ricin-type beta-trefoil lectin domain-like/Fibronectin type III domain
MAARRSRQRHRRLPLIAAVLIGAAATVPVAASTGAGGLLPGSRAADTETVAAPPSAGALKPAEVAKRAAVAPAKPVVKPKDQPRRGLVYRGLTPAKSGICVGGYHVGTSGLCTHGPDAPQPGQDIAKDVPPVAATPAVKTSAGAEKTDADLAAEAAPGEDAVAASASAVPCDGDGASGNRVQVLYVHAATDRYAQYLESFRTWASGIDTIYDASAQQTGGERHVRFVSEAVGGECRAVVANVTVSASALADFGATNRELSSQGWNRRDRKYVIFADTNVYCGIGGFAGDSRPDAANRSNVGPSYGRTDSGCWGASTASHELGHNLGAVNNNAPHTSGGGHCVDEYDVMCYSDSPNYPSMQVLCSDRNNNNRLDCNHDDYYSTDPAAGSYLATHWNVADNAFLIQGPDDGGGGGTTPDTTAPSVPAGLTAANVTATGLMLSWTASTDNVAVTAYEVRRDGAAIGTTATPGFTVTGLTAETAYSFSVVAKDAAGNASAPSAGLAVTTAAGGGGGGGGSGPQAGVPYVLANGLTGRVADVFRASTASGAAVIQYPAHGGANQRWTFTAATDGTWTIRSVASGLCLDVASRGRVVQATCVAGKASQTWTATAEGNGVRLSPLSAPTQVLGLSSYTLDGSRQLGLRTPSSQVAQSTVWTLTAG